MNKRTLVVGLMSITLLSLELVWTRLFSAEFFYTYAFLMLSLAVMGMGLGALGARMTPGFDRPALVGVWLSLAGVFAILGPPMVFRLGIDFTQLYGNWLMLGKFVLTLLLLGLPFYFSGIALASIFKRHYKEMPRLYSADLIGAGAGVFIAIVLMNRLGTPTAVFWLAIPLLLAALVAARWWFKIVPVALIVLVFLINGHADTLLEVQREERAPVAYKHWDAMSKVKMYVYGGYYRGINVDNVANSPVIPFDGDWEAFEEELGPDGWDIDVGYLIDRFDDCTFLSLGSGGGSDVMQALMYGAAEIHAVEVNPHINKMMLEGDPAGYIVRDSLVVDSTGALVTCAEFSGHIFSDSRVKVVSEDARTYVRRHKNKFDVIYSLSSNTWAALGSGSFSLAENYIFTTEAFKDYWEALSEDGFLSMEHQVYMPRLVGEVVDALTGLGIENPTDHFAVYNLPKLRRNLLLLSKRPLDDALRQNAYKAMRDGRHDFIEYLYPAPDSLESNIVNQIVTKGWRAAADSADINISPCTDDRPFVAQMGLWRNFNREKLGGINQYSEFRGFPVSKIIIFMILAVVIVLVIPLMLIPYLTRGEKLRPAGWLYFFLIGLAFMSVEVVLIQKYALFIGASVYSIATVLLSLLIASGIGSRFAGRVPVGAAFFGILVWILVELFLLKYITASFTGLPMMARAVVAGALVFPLGFFMGIPFPKGALRVGELVDWGFAVNGVASVLGGTAIVLVSFTWGFTVALFCAAFCYAAAWLLISMGALWE